jgi:hypothetical protein
MKPAMRIELRMDNVRIPVVEIGDGHLILCESRITRQRTTLPRVDPEIIISIDRHERAWRVLIRPEVGRSRIVPFEVFARG